MTINKTTGLPTKSTTNVRPSSAESSIILRVQKKAAQKAHNVDTEAQCSLAIHAKYVHVDALLTRNLVFSRVSISNACEVHRKAEAYLTACPQ